MSRRFATTLAGVALSAPLAITAPADAAALRICRGTIANIVVSDSIRVPAGASCTLRNVAARGAVVVESGATLIVTNSQVARSVTSTGHRKVSIENTRVTGAVSLNKGGAISILYSSFGADITLTANTKTGTKVLRGNGIDGRLSCTLNAPAPTGSLNSVRGGKFGQCKRV